MTNIAPQFRQTASNGTFYMYYRLLDDDILELKQTSISMSGWNYTRQK